MAAGRQYACRVESKHAMLVWRRGRGCCMHAVSRAEMQRVCTEEGRDAIHVGNGAGMPRNMQLPASCY